MKLKYVLGIIAICLLFGCAPKEDTSEKLLSSGIQYLGSQETIMSALESLEIDYENPSTLNLELEEYKLVMIEPNYIEKVSQDKLLQALNNNFYIFFINLEDSRLIQEQFFNTIIYHNREQDKIWAEQLYLKNGLLDSIVFSIEPNIEEELLKWLQYFDKHKEDSNDE